MEQKVKRVSTAIVESGERGRVLILKRSQKVHSCQGLWACCSGSIESGESPDQCARRELLEETGLGEADVILVRAGRPFSVSLPRSKSIVEVNPFLFRLRGVSLEEKITIDWEHDCFRFARSEELLALETVPRLAETFERVDLDPESEADVAAIAGNVVDGAAHIARDAATLFGRCVERNAAGPKTMTPAAFARALAFHFATAKPTMAPVAAAVCHSVKEAISEVGEAAEWSSLRGAIATATAATSSGIAGAGEVAASRWISGVGRGDAVLTHSLSSTVLRALLSPTAVEKSLKIFVTESRTACEGIAAAKKLVASGLDVTVIPDCAVVAILQRLVSEGASPKVVVGADTIFGDGSFFNKTGTHTIALACKELGIRLTVLADSLKIGPTKTAPSCFAGLDHSFAFGDGIRGWNPVFELTPAMPNVIEFVTELGVMGLEAISEFSVRSKNVISSVLDPSE